jgi:cardiolipin synthase A/B
MDYAFGAAVLVASLIAGGHAVVYKRDPRSATVWLLVILMLPAVGPVLYALLGVNRVERRAARMRRERSRQRVAPPATTREPGPHFAPLARTVAEVVERPLTEGNAVRPLVDGREAYPAMLAAIDEAAASIMLSSYIFHRDGIGAEFVAALVRARERGVEVRVLVDDVDVRFSISSAIKPLRRAGVPTGVFNPPLVPARLHAVHLRNHRKILVVDGRLGFTGGMNIDRRYWGARPFHDLHFMLRGPVVAHLAEAFADDWLFATDETLSGMPWFPELATEGPSLARGIDGGPDNPVEPLRWAIIGALNASQRSVRVITPYFLPDAPLVSALNAAALRGVEVDIVLPAHNDVPHVKWASMHGLWQVLEAKCRVWISPGQFDHSKLMVVDGGWTLLGSSNWDARSLRLNFELDVECYCAELGARMERFALERRTAARPVTLADVNGRSFPVKLRDGVARLFSPLL